MSTSMWLDITLHTALEQQLSAAKMAETAALLAGLGMRQAVICLKNWQQYRPDLAAVRERLDLIGVIDSAEALALAQQAGLQQVMLVCPTLSPRGPAAVIGSVLNQAAAWGMQVSLVLENISGDWLAQTVSVSREYPVAAAIYHDQLGQADVFTVFEQISLLKESMSCPVGIWAGNTYGLGTALTLSALKAGAKLAVTAVGGIGAAAAAWEEVLMALRQLEKRNIDIPAGLAPLCGQLYTKLGKPVPAAKAIIGQAIFAHESGLHVDGITKAPELYEPFPPELVGLKRQLIIGKHSGTAALKAKFAAWGISLAESETKALLAGVRALAVQKKADISDAELQRLYLSG